MHEIMHIIATLATVPMIKVMCMTVVAIVNGTAII